MRRPYLRTGSFLCVLWAFGVVFVLTAPYVAAPTILDPDTENLVKGSGTWTFPGDLTSDNGVYVDPAEADQSVIVDLTADTEGLTKGTRESGTFPTDANTDNGVTITYREANQAPTGTIAFDAAFESERTGTTDPHTWTHTPVGAPRAVLVSSVHGVTATEHVLSCSYGSASMSKIVTASDTATEPGRATLWFVGSSIPTGAQTVSCDLDSGTADDIHFVSVTYTGSADATVIDTDSISENAANPSRTLQFGGQRATAIMAVYSGTANVPLTSACSGNSACTLDANFDMGAFVASNDRETTPGTLDQVMGYTIAGDDLAFVTAAFTDESAADYEIEIRYAWTGESCSNTRRLTVNSWHTDSENIRVEVEDGSDTDTFVLRLTITATADGTTLTYDLSTAEWDAGEPRLRFLGSSESGDTTQTDLINDYVVVRCIPPADYELEYQVGWTGETCAQTRTLRVSAHHDTAEDFLLQVDDGSESSYTTRITVTSTSDPSPTYQEYELLDAEWDAGAPSIRFIGSSESGDTVQTTLFIDDLEIECADPPGGTHNSLVDIYSTVGTNCDAFAGTGQRIRSGLDDGDPGGTADDGILDDQEVDDTGYVCDGAPGADGADGATGANGADGPPGPRGPPGESWFLLVIAALGLGGFIALARRNTDGE